MGYQVPTLEQGLGFLISLGKALLPDRNFGSRFAPGWKLVKVMAGAMTDVNAHVDSAMRDVMADTAKAAALDRFLKIFAPGGLAARKGATPARKAAAGRVRGSLGSTSALGDQLVHKATGLIFQINNSVTIPAGLFFDADILAVSTGSATRLKKGEILEYLATPAGLTTQVELQLDLDQDGVDQEADGDARNRLLAALSTPAAGGNQGDYVGWMLAQLGIARAFCYPARAGLGTIDVAALHAGLGINRILTGPEMSALLGVLITFAPAQVAGTGGSLRMLQVIGGNADAAMLANVEMTITPNGLAPNAMDWDDSGAPTVLAYTAGTRTLQFAGGARPSTMQAGHRIVLKGVGSLQDGTVMTVLALSGVDSIILQDTPTVSPAATDVVYAAGPLTKKIRDAILAHINGDTLYLAASGPLPAATAASQSISTVNLQVLADGLGTANPAGTYGAWTGSLLKAQLAKIAMLTPGVRNQNVITPAADQDATDYAFPLDAQIGLLTPGYVLVRKG